VRAGRSTCSAACGEGAKPRTRSTRPPKPGRLRRGWPWRRKRRTCTSPSAGFRRASRSAGSKRRRGVSFFHGPAPVREGHRRRAAAATGRGLARSGRGADSRPGSRLDSAMNALDVLLGVPPGTYRAELSGAAPVPVAPGLAGTGTPRTCFDADPTHRGRAAPRRSQRTHRRGDREEYYPRFSQGALLGSATAIASGNLLTGGASQAQGATRTSVAPVRLRPRRRADRRCARPRG
jgi:hypothetical protein